MVGRSHLLAAVALLSLFAATASAEPIVVKSGFLLMTGPSEVGEVSISGTRGFSLRGPVNTSEGGSPAFFDCISFQCAPGMRIDIAGGFSDLAFGTDRLTVEGQDFVVTGGIDGTIGMLLVFAGSAVMPPLGTRPALVRAPFSMEGFLFFSPFGPRYDLTGRGVVEVSLLEGTLPDVGDGWMIDAIRWEFQDSAPVPEPGTLLLVASGAAVLARARHRTRRVTS
jgi:hypothetical protein